MASSQLHISCMNDEKKLVQEFRDYTENWVHRMRLLRPTNEPQAIAREVFDELLHHMLVPLNGMNPFPKQIHDFVTSNLCHGVTLKELSKFLGYSEKYCSEFFQSQMGEPFSVYLRRIRVEKAQRLLEDENLGLAQIADALGFHDQFAFSHFFKKVTGSSPKQYRESQPKTDKAHSDSTEFVHEWEQVTAPS